MKTYLVIYFGAAFLTILVTPLLSRLAKRRGLLDATAARKVHKVPVARIGGIAFVVSTLPLILAVFLLDNTIGQAFRSTSVPILVLLGASLLVFVVGLIDDLASVRSSTKLLCLVAAALGVCLAGSRIETVMVSGLFRLNLGLFSWPLTVVWIVGVTVAMNFIDGLDGLASGICLAVFATIGLFAFMTGQLAMVVLAVAMLGTLTGFMFFNFNPAKIFMGDGGSMFLGFIVGAGSVVCQAKTSALVGLAAPALALGVPLFDAVLTMIRRTVLDRRSILTAERGHIHHRLLDRGLSHRSSVLAIYVATLAAGTAGCSMLILREGLQIAMLICGVAVLLLVFYFAGVMRIHETLEAIRRNLNISSRIRREKAVFEDVQLMVRQAASFDAWWAAACTLAERMEFERLALSAPNGNGNGSSTIVWRRSEQALSRPNVVTFIILAPGNGTQAPSRIEVSAQPGFSLETIGRRMSLFGRLLDESDVPERSTISPTSAGKGIPVGLGVGREESPQTPDGPLAVHEGDQLADKQATSFPPQLPSPEEADGTVPEDAPCM